MGRKPIQFEDHLQVRIVPLPPERRAAWNESMNIFARWAMPKKLAWFMTEDGTIAVQVVEYDEALNGELRHRFEDDPKYICITEPDETIPMEP